MISDDERKTLIASRQKAGHTDAHFADWLKAKHGHDIRRGWLPKRLYDEVLARVSQPEPLELL